MKMKHINGYEGRYAITDTGVVISLGRKGLGSPNEDTKMSPCIGGGGRSGGRSGYFKVCLRNGTGRKSFYVHRLVAEHFLYRVHGKKFVNHKNGNTRDNRISNLEWCSQAENVRHYHSTIDPKIKKARYRKVSNSLRNTWAIKKRLTIRTIGSTGWL